MYLNAVLKCSNCYKPIEKRLGFFKAHDDYHYECLADSYVNRFWALCDVRHESKESLRPKSDSTVITMQPERIQLPCKNE